MTYSKNFFSLFRHKGFIVSLIAILAFTFLLSTYLVYSKTRKQSRAIGGFDYKVVESEPWAGPEPGQKLDFSKLKDSEGIPLSSKNIKSPVMLGLINTGCGMCTIAKEHLKYVKDNCEQAAIPYVLINVSAKKTTKAHQFMQGLGLGVPTYVWLHDESTIQKLYLMVSPSHLLVSSDGAIIAKWPGSSDMPERRDRMGNQTVADMWLQLTMPR